MLAVGIHLIGLAGAVLLSQQNSGYDTRATRWPVIQLINADNLSDRGGQRLEAWELNLPSPQLNLAALETKTSERPIVMPALIAPTAALLKPERLALAPVPTARLLSPALPAPHIGAQYLHTPKPPYPQSAQRLRQEGTVILAIEVNEQGRATKVEAKTSSGFDLLDEAAIKAAREWEFVPARIGSNAFSSVVEVPLAFKLSELPK